MSLQLVLYCSSTLCCVYFAFSILLSGAKVNWVNEDDECKTALHQSILGVRFLLSLQASLIFD